MAILKRILPILVLGVFLVGVIRQISPPQTFTQASMFQLLIFFIPLFLFLFFTVNAIIRFFLFSLILSFGLILIFVFRALDFLNPLTLIVIIVAIFLILRSLSRPHKKFYQAKIPRLSKLAKQ